jgi:hypothetical protein
MFIYREFYYNKYTYDKVKFGINIAKNTTKLKHSYTGLDRTKHNTIITEPQEIVQFLEHLLALAQPVQNEADEQRIETIKPILNQMYGYIQSAEIQPDDTFLEVDLGYYSSVSPTDVPCPCGERHKRRSIGVRAKASKNFTTGEEKLELRQECPKSIVAWTPEEEYLTVYTQDTLNLNRIPEPYKSAWKLHYRAATRI